MAGTSDYLETKILDHVLRATSYTALEYNAAGSNWGTVTHVGVLDASSSGNLLYHSALTTSKAITTGDIFRIPAGSLTVTMT